MKYRISGPIWASIALASLLLPFALTASEPSEAEGAESSSGPRKLALLVGVSKYTASGWSDLNTARDLERMRNALEAQGFAAADIRELKDLEADREGIAKAFREHLIEQAKPGDIAFFHYSGHGQRITDNNHDEPDGYDEALVPHDAPLRPPAGYAEGPGFRHIRDDELNGWIQELRRKAGPQGEVLFSMDSCYSGSGTRAAMGLSRGTDEPIGPPQEGAQGEDEGAGIEVAASQSRGVGAAPAAGDGLAPYVVLSAARFNELAYETRDEENNSMGSLSFALSSALAGAGSDSTYRSVFVEVQRIMAAAEVPNRPQAEGLLDRKILAGQAVVQEPFFRVTAYDPESGRVKLNAGVLGGLLVGSKVGLYPPDTRDPEEGTELARGNVAKASPFSADVDLETLAEGADVEAAWAFVLERAYGRGSLRVVLSGDCPGEETEGPCWREDIERDLGDQQFIEIVDEGADVALSRTGTEILATGTDGTELLRLKPDDPQRTRRLVSKLDDYARNRWLRRIEEKSRNIKVRFELRPCELQSTTTSLGEEVVSCEPKPPPCAAGEECTGNDLELAVGEAFEIVIVNEGRKNAYVSILDLMPDGQIGLLWPFPENEGEDNLIKRGDSYIIEVPFTVGPPLGIEMLKLMATSDPVDFRAITTGGFQTRGAGGGLMDTLFADAFQGTRAAASVSTSSVATFTQTLRIVAADGE